MRAYSFVKLNIIVSGVPLSGFASGDDVVQGARREDAFSDEVGADGEMLVTQTANRSGSMTFRLQRGSDSNVLLSTLFQAQEKATVFSPIPVAVVDTVSGVQLGGTKGYLTRPADVTSGSAAGALEWTIVLENYEAIFTPADEI